MINAGVILPYTYENQASPVFDASYREFLDLIASSGNELFRLYVLDFTSLDQNGLINAYDVSEKQLTRPRVSSFDIIHFLDFDSYHFRKMTLSEKWSFVIEKLDIFEKYEVSYINSIESLRYFINKKYLLDLSQKGVSVIPSKFISGYDIKVFTKENNIIKPANGENGKFIYLLDKIKPREIQLLQLQADTFIVQPYMYDVTEGEISLIYISGRFSHAVIKTPKQNETKVKKGIILDFVREAYYPSDEELNFGYMVKDALEHQLDIFRIDFIKGRNGMQIMEVESVDPYHYSEFITQQYAKTIIELYQNKILENESAE